MVRIPWGKATFAMALSGAVVPMRAGAHPLHTTYTELTISGGHTARAMIRVFADDFTAIVLRAYPVAKRSPRDFERAAYTYVARRFALVDSAGTRYSLGWCGLRREANFIWLCVGSDHFSADGRPQLVNRLLNEVYSDQINVVRVSTNGRRRLLLFARGDGAKPLADR